MWTWTYRIKRHRKYKWVAQLRVLGIYWTVAIPHVEAFVDLKSVQSCVFKSKSLFKNWERINLKFELEVKQTDDILAKPETPQV